MKRVWFALTVAAVVAWSLAPFLWQIATSLKPDSELTLLPPILPANPTLNHYAEVFRTASFLRIIANSAVVATLSTLLSIGVGSPAAFGLAKLQVRLKGLILLFLLSASMFPPIATVSPLYLIIRSLDFRDTVWALVMTYTSFSLPLSVWVMTHFFRQIPDELYKASRIDGCSPLQSFLRIMLPLSAPGLLTAALLVFIFSWNEFLFALTFTATPNSQTIPVAIAMFPGLHEVPWGEIAAASVIVTIPLVVLVLLFQRRIVDGLTAGAVIG